MKKPRLLLLVSLGIVCVLCLLGASWYSIQYNESRLVVPMDFGDYTFRIGDIPMIGSLLLLWAYILLLCIMLFRAVVRKNMSGRGSQRTRKLNPKLGFLGLLGLLGFLGFWTYRVDQTVFPFAFFLFFGFFGFFYEGKMSDTLMDERFQENARRAQLTALKISFGINFIALIILCQRKLFGELEYTLIAILIILALSAGLELFLSEYLLYRYDHEGRYEESEE